MGGWGSTRWNGYKRKWRVDECLCLDIDELVRAGLLHHTTSKIEFSDENGQTTLLLFHLKPSDVPKYSYLNLIFCVPSEGPIPIREAVTLERRAQRLGGFRYYFISPYCDAWRVRKYYLAPGSSTFACRNCQRLTYRSAAATQQANRHLSSKPGDAHGRAESWFTLSLGICPLPCVPPETADCYTYGALQTPQRAKRSLVWLCAWFGSYLRSKPFLAFFFLDL